MRILCLIHTFNDEEVIDRCVESVLAQTRPPDQLLIVDNYLCRNLLNCWVFEFRGQVLRAAAPRVLKALLLTLNFMLRPVSRKAELARA